MFPQFVWLQIGSLCASIVKNSAFWDMTPCSPVSSFMFEQHAKQESSKQSVTPLMKATPQQTNKTTLHVSPVATALCTVMLASQAIPDVSWLVEFLSAGISTSAIRVTSWHLLSPHCFQQQSVRSVTGMRTISPPPLDDVWRRRLGNKWQPTAASTASKKVKVCVAN